MRFSELGSTATAQRFREGPDSAGDASTREARILLQHNLTTLALANLISQVVDNEQPERRRWARAACIQCGTPSARAIVLVNRSDTVQGRRLAGHKSTQWAIKVARLLT